MGDGGTNPAVKSIYSRILALNPAVRGHEVNLAQDGATLEEFAVQVRKAIALKPAPELALVQIIDNDIKCDGRDESRYPDFGAELTAALESLSAGLPKAQIFVISPWGTFASYVQTLPGLDKGARLKHAGEGPCSIFAPATGRLLPRRSSRPGLVCPPLTVRRGLARGPAAVSVSRGCAPGSCAALPSRRCSR